MLLPEGLSAIGDKAFSGCGSLAALRLPASLAEIGAGAFSGCPLLRELEIAEDSEYFRLEDAVLFTADGTELAAYPLWKEDESYVVPDGVTVIRGEAFASCAKLTAVTLPASLTTIGDQAFYGCEGLTEASYAGTREQWEAVSVGSGNEALLALIDFGGD